MNVRIRVGEEALFMRNLPMRLAVLCLIGVVGLSACGKSDVDQSSAPEGMVYLRDDPNAPPPTAEQAQVSVSEDALVFLRTQIDSKTITGLMIDEITEVIEAGDDERLEPLYERIALLRREPDTYGEDFALWWKASGKSQLGGAIFYKRELLREAIGTLLDDGDETEALSKFAEAAETGDPVATLWLDLMRSQGQQRPSASMAAELEQLAENGDAEAAFTLAILTFEGVEVAGATNSKVVEWFEMAAESGNARAMEQLARLYSDGDGVPRDAAAAEEWRRKAEAADPETTRRIRGADAASKISRTRADMRSLATGLESYFIDHNDYPAWTLNEAESINSELAARNPDLEWDRPSFRRKLNNTDRLYTLTTPISYLRTYLADPFAEPLGRTFNYMAVPQPGETSGNRLGWIVWSPGPDGDYDLDGSEYNPRQAVPSPDLVAKTYDPTNGAISNGDVWRIKE